jgi:hypothetical protein
MASRRPAPQLLARFELLAKTCRCGPAGLTAVGQHAHPRIVGRHGGGHPDQRVLDAYPRGREVGLHRALVVPELFDADTRPATYLARVGHHHVDVLVTITAAHPVRPQGRAAAERCRRGVQQSRPGSLLPGEGSGVVDVHAGVHACPPPTPQHPGDQPIVGAGGQHLAP